MVCLIAGCSKTSQVTTPENMELRDNGPFMSDLKDIATKREGLYFLGQPIDKAEYERRESDIGFQRDYGSVIAVPIEHFVGVPIVLIRF